ncbi:hypothetical protein [Streptodolium elevatio]|uniref:RNA polymerase subunit sigma-70 n=1 Tax=Streptodolium elevatio TaxID=3157996 RepID=A0ABV3DGR5_9ACTN
MAANPEPASKAPVPSAPTGHSDRALARIALSADAAAVARQAIQFIDPVQDPPSDLQATLVARSAKLVAAAEGVHRAAVVHERARGTAWSEIGRQLGVARQTAQERFGSAVEDWTRRLAQDRSPRVLDRERHRAVRVRKDFDAVIDWLDRELSRMDPRADAEPLVFDESALADRIDQVAAWRDEAAAERADDHPEHAAGYREDAANRRLYAAELRAYAARRAVLEAARPVVLLPEDEDLAALLRLVDEPLLSGLRLVDPDDAEEFGQWKVPDTFALEQAYDAFGRIWAALPEPVRRPADASSDWLAAPDGARALVPVHAVHIDPDDLAVLWHALEELRSALAGRRDDQLLDLLGQVADTGEEARTLGPVGLVDALARLLAILAHTPDPGLANALRRRAAGDTLVLGQAQYAAYRRLAETWTLLLRSGTEGMFKY